MSTSSPAQMQRLESNVTQCNLVRTGVFVSATVSVSAFRSLSLAQSQAASNLLCAGTFWYISRVRVSAFCTICSVDSDARALAVAEVCSIFSRAEVCSIFFGTSSHMNHMNMYCAMCIHVLVDRESFNLISLRMLVNSLA